jgi:hypothetical protein
MIYWRSAWKYVAFSIEKNNNRKTVVKQCMITKQKFKNETYEEKNII